MVLTIPEMHSHLEQLNQFFSERTTYFSNKIQEHPGSYTTQDYTRFAALIEEIRTEALQRISDFFKEKHSGKTDLYESEVNFSSAR